jgi:hypothetical protein
VMLSSIAFAGKLILMFFICLFTLCFWCAFYIISSPFRPLKLIFMACVGPLVINCFIIYPISD